MNEKRKRTEAYILEHMSHIDKTGANTKYYQQLFEKMSDADFDQWMRWLKNNDTVLVAYFPNMKSKITIPDLLEECKRLGIKLFTRLKLWDEVTQSYYITPKEYMMLQLPVRRMSQFIDHKLTVPESDQRIDLLSGQVMKPDQASSLSQVEVQTLYARGLTNSILELIKYRGGDLTAMSDYKRELEEQGQTSVAKDTGSIVRSAVILDVLLSGVHIESNISGL